MNQFRGDGGNHGRGQSKDRATQQGAATPGQSTSDRAAQVRSDLDSAAGNVAEPQLGPTGHRAEHSPSPRSFVTRWRAAMATVIRAIYQIDRKRGREAASVAVASQRSKSKLPGPAVLMFDLGLEYEPDVTVRYDSDNPNDVHSTVRVAPGELRRAADASKERR